MKPTHTKWACEKKMMDCRIRRLVTVRNLVEMERTEKGDMYRALFL